MGQFIDSLGSAAAGGIPGAIMGMMLGGYNDERQEDQQRRLQALQISGQKELTDYNMMKQFEMWRKTNFSEQIKQMKIAGLSPGLIYGKGGAGGTTTGGTSGSVQGASAPVGGREVQDLMGMGMQLQLLQAQKENIKADTELKRADAIKKGGADTNLIRSQIMLNTAGVETEFAKQGLMKIQTGLGEIEKEIQGRSIEASIRYIDWKAETLWGEVQDWRYKNNISDETWQTTVKQIQANLIQTWIRSANIKSGTEVNEQTLLNLANDIVQKRYSNEFSERSTRTGEKAQWQSEWLNDVQKSTGIPLDILEEAVDGIFRAFPNKRQPIRRYKEGGNSKGTYWETTSEY